MNENLRPCLISDGRRALFHGWNFVSYPVAPSVIMGEHKGGQFSSTYGIVEYSDGSVENVSPRDITFLDNLAEEKLKSEPNVPSNESEEPFAILVVDKSFAEKNSVLIDKVTELVPDLKIHLIPSNFKSLTISKIGECHSSVSCWSSPTLQNKKRRR